MNNPQTITFNKSIQEIRDIYSAIEPSNFTALIMGKFGTGKTSFLCTGRRPILIDSFDPKGTVVINKMYPDEINKTIFIRPFWEESTKHPKQYAKWERQWQEDIKSGFLDSFGTYGIDSMTTFVDALANKVHKERGRTDPFLAQADYVPMYNTIKDVVKITSTQKCDFILTAHLVDTQDEVTGAVLAELDTYKKLKSQIPLLFTEKYVIMDKKSSQGVRKVLLTGSRGRFRASTQLGAGGTFDIEEEPNIKGLLKKAGFPIVDKSTTW